MNRRQRRGSASGASGSSTHSSKSRRAEKVQKKLKGKRRKKRRFQAFLQSQLPGGLAARDEMSSQEYEARMRELRSRWNGMNESERSQFRRGKSVADSVSSDIVVSGVTSGVKRRRVSEAGETAKSIALPDEKPTRAGSPGAFEHRGASAVCLTTPGAAPAGPASAKGSVATTAAAAADASASAKEDTVILDVDGDPLVNAMAGRNIRSILKSLTKSPDASALAGDEFLQLPPKIGATGAVTPESHQQNGTAARNSIGISSNTPSFGDLTSGSDSDASDFGEASIPVNPLLSLHNEILEFEDYISPTAEEHNRRMDVFRVIESVAKAVWHVDDKCGTLSVEVFGSTLTGLALPSSDVDIVVFGASGPVKRNMHKFAQELRRRDLVSFIEVRDRARVPIINLVHKETGVEADICFDQESGPRMGKVIKRMLDQIPGLRPLVLVLKYYLAQRQLNVTYRGGVGSFLLQLMVIASLQHHSKIRCYKRWISMESLTDRPGMSRAARVKERKRLKRKFDREPSHSLGLMLMEFFEFYGRQLHYHDVGISLRGEGSLFSKRERRWYDMKRPWALCMENPEDPNHDVGKNSFQMQNVKRAFEHSFDMLSRRIEDWAKKRAKIRHSTHYNDEDVAQGDRRMSYLSLVIDVQAAKEASRFRVGDKA